MEFRVSRLRAGEWLSLVFALVVLALLFLPDWYGSGSAPGGAGAPRLGGLTGWEAVCVLRWPVLVCALLGLLLAGAQASRRAPALPVSLAVLQVAVGGITALVLALRLALGHPGGPRPQQAGGWLTALALALLGGAGVLSLRQEGVREEDGPGHVETVRLERPA